MCRSSVTLFYGLWVKSWSLAFAADAFSKIHPTLLGIDLIARRRREGKLKVEEQDEKTTARDLPGEVWELVKQEIIDSGLEEADTVQVVLYRCPTCRYALGQILDQEMRLYPEFPVEPRDATDLWTHWNDPKCKQCLDWITGITFFWMQEDHRARVSSAFRAGAENSRQPR